jgi:hypothetical protein
MAGQARGIEVIWPLLPIGLRLGFLLLVACVFIKWAIDDIRRSRHSPKTIFLLVAAGFLAFLAVGTLLTSQH